MNRELKIIFFIVAGAGIFYIPFIGNLHLFDWDEINFAEAAREMLVTGDYLTVQIFFEPFWEKPPLFIWLQAASMHLFGVNEFAARFPNAIAGVLTLFVLYRLGKRMVNERFGIIWAIAYGASLLPFFYFKSGIIDPWFNFFIFMGVIYYMFAQNHKINKKKYINAILSAAFIGLAVLTKGPAAILIFGLTIFMLLLLTRFKLKLFTGHVITFIVALTFVGGFWFLLQIAAGNYDTVVDFVVYQVRLFKTEDAGHGGFPLYHFVVLFFGVFPATAFAIHAHKKRTGYNDEMQYLRLVMLTLFWVVLILFSIVKTKIVHYSSLCYFPMSFLAAYSVNWFLENRKKLPLWLAAIQIVTATLIGLILFFLPIFDRYKQWFIDTGKITHSFTVGNLQADPGWLGWEWIIGLILMFGSLLAIIWLRRNKQVNGFRLLAASSAVFMFLSIVVVTPKMEKYSQNAAIEFMKSKRNQDVYVGTLYRSYAKFFYPQIKPMGDMHPFMQSWDAETQKGNKDFYFTRWLSTGDIDKPAFLIVRKDKLEENLNRYPELELIEEKNGYGFLKRMPKSKE